MFDDLNNKKGEIEDIFADTEQESLAKKNEELPSNPPANIPVLKEKVSEDVETVKKQDSDYATGKKKKLLKLMIIAGLVILLSVAAYFAYSYFMPSSETDLENNIVIVESNVNEQDSQNNWPELIDPNLIIPEEEEVAPEPEPIIEEETVSPIWLERINTTKLALVDSDSDGLNDLAEEYIGTDPNNADTDGDSYSDLSEILNSYNPLGEGVLPVDFLITHYQDEIFELLHHSQASISLDNTSNTKLITITWPSLDILDYQIGIYVQENLWKADVFSWYASQFPNASRVDNSRIVSHPNLGAGIIDEDGLAIYFVSADYSKIITISWQDNLGLEDYNLISVIMSDLKINN